MDSIFTVLLAVPRRGTATNVIYRPANLSETGESEFAELDAMD